MATLVDICPVCRLDMRPEMQHTSKFAVDQFQCESTLELENRLLLATSNKALVISAKLLGAVFQKPPTFWGSLVQWSYHITLCSIAWMGYNSRWPL